MSSRRDTVLEIVHITAHCGGGVGTVLQNYLKYKKGAISQKHEIISLDSINTEAKSFFKNNAIEFIDNIHKKYTLLRQKVKNADIIVLHWWNHPLMMDLLVNVELPACRIAIWSHISGTPPPNTFTNKLFEYPDIFIFTTPLSYLTPEYKNLSEKNKKRIRLIWSTGGVERLKNLKLTKHNYFHIGYIGNLDFTKIHPDFVGICKQVCLKNTRLTVIGPKNKKILDQVKNLKLSRRVRFTGYISEKDKWSELSTFDVFGYPLASHHYGTCDQALQEAMAVGAVPVVLNNPMESFMVQNNRTGLVANSISDYISSLGKLKKDFKLRKKLSNNAKKYAFKEYSLNKMARKWDNLYADLIRIKKTAKVWKRPSKSIKLKSYAVFVESLGANSGIFDQYLTGNNIEKVKAIAQMASLGRKENWTSENKSTVHQYAKFFPKDKILQRWSKIMKS
jgi:glycosyltransferase involved in cell wall biosynthesis